MVIVSQINFGLGGGLPTSVHQPPGPWQLSAALGGGAALVAPAPLKESGLDNRT